MTYLVKNELKLHLHTFTELVLLDQPYIKDSSLTVEQLVKQTAGKIGENIKVRRFTRYTLGEGIEVEEVGFAEEVASLKNNLGFSVIRRTDGSREVKITGDLDETLLNTSGAKEKLEELTLTQKFKVIFLSSFQFFY